MLGCRCFPQITEPTVAEFLFHALSQLVRFAQKTTRPRLFSVFALVIHEEPFVSRLFEGPVFSMNRKGPAFSTAQAAYFNKTFGCRAAIFSNTRAAPEGRLRPCSHS